MTRTYRAIETMKQRERLLARAHREIIGQLDVLIPWASPAILRTLRLRYGNGFVNGAFRKRR